MGVQGAAIITSLSKLNLSTTCKRDNKFAQKTFWCYIKLPNNVAIIVTIKIQTYTHEKVVKVKCPNLGSKACNLE